MIQRLPLSSMLTVALPSILVLSILSRTQANCITGLSTEQDGVVNTYYSYVLDLTDVRDELKIVAHTTEECNCVQMAFGDDDTERYAFLDFDVLATVPGGDHSLQVWAYESENCQGDVMDYHTEDFTVIPIDTPLRGTVAATPFRVQFETTVPPVSQTDTTEAVEHVCWYLQQALSDSLLYKADVSMDWTTYMCEGSAVPNSEPLEIEFDRIEASFVKSTGFNPYTNRLFPTTEDIDDAIQSVISGFMMASVFSYATLLDEIGTKLSGTNAYQSATDLILVVEQPQPPSNPATTRTPPANTTVTDINVVRLVLMNAETNKRLRLVQNGDRIRLSKLQTTNLNIKAVTDPWRSGSVRFEYDNVRHIENHTPYALVGDTNGNYKHWTPTVGSHTLTVTPFTLRGGRGDAGASMTVSFTVLD